MNLYIDSLSRPAQDLIVAPTVPVKSANKLPRISTKQLVSVRTSSAAGAAAVASAGAARSHMNRTEADRLLSQHVATTRSFTINANTRKITKLGDSASVVEPTQQASGFCFYK